MKLSIGINSKNFHSVVCGLVKVSPMLLLHASTRFQATNPLVFEKCPPLGFGCYTISKSGPGYLPGDSTITEA